LAFLVQMFNFSSIFALLTTVCVWLVASFEALSFRLTLRFLNAKKLKFSTTPPLNIHFVSNCF